MRTMQAFGMERAHGRALRRRRRGGLRGGARSPPACGSLLTGIGHLPGLGERRRRALVRRAGRAGRHHDGGPAVAIRALRGLRGELARPALRGLRRARAGRRRGRAPRRDPGHRARHRGAGRIRRPCRSRRAGTIAFEDVRFAYPTRARAAGARRRHASRVGRASGSPSSGPRAPARARCCSCCCASTIRKAGASCVDGVAGRARSIPRPCAPASPWCRRSRRSSARACSRTSATAGPTPREDEVRRAADLAVGRRLHPAPCRRATTR